MPGKRKRQPKSKPAAPEQKQIIMPPITFDSRALKIAINTAQFRGRLYPDIQSLKRAIELADRVGPTGLDLFAVTDIDGVAHITVYELWISSGACNWASDTVEHRIMSRLLNIINESGVLDVNNHYDHALQECANRGTAVQMEMLLELQKPITWIIWMCLEKDKWNVGNERSVACQLIKRMSDKTLNSVETSTADSFINVLKMAVQYHRPCAISAIMKRFPQIEFDLVVLDSPLAEPMSLSIPSNGDSPQATETRELIIAGERMTQTYYREKIILLRHVLEIVIISELTAIVVSYAERMPLSTVALKPNS